VIPLVANANTATEIKYYMLQAAAGLLSAADINDPKVRKHAAEPKVIGELVKAIQDCITNPAMLLPGFKKETATPEQIPVLVFVRRQAIKALGQVKFVIVPGPDGRTPIYPAYTLVRVAMNDPAILLPSTPADAAEVVLGLCNMAPMQWQGTQTAAVRTYNADVAVEAIMQALATFAGQRAANPFDRSLPWRGYSLRIAEALLRWQQLFDPNFDKLQPNKASANLVPAVVKEMCKEVIPNILAKIEKVDGSGQPDPTATVKIGDLQMRLDAMRQNPKRKKTLFEGVPETSIEFAPAEK
jgi:hypothetical protein